MSVNLPPGFIEETITREGKAGKVWIDSLPRTIRELCDRWQLSIVGPVMHGYTGIAFPVRHVRTDCILKVYWRNRENDSAPLALKAWNGRGAVMVLDHDKEKGAVLLEKLDSNHSLEQVDIGEAVPIAGALIRRLAIPAPKCITRVSCMVPQLITNIKKRWADFGRPFPEKLRDNLCAWAEELGPESRNLMADYDLHYTDILASSREPWLMIDPKAVSGDPEFSAAQLLWTRLEDMEARRGVSYYFRALTDIADLDFELARRWAIIRSADYWLWGLTVGLTYDPDRCERIIRVLTTH